MNEELKIIIKAVTDGAKKGINDVKKELDGVSKSSKGIGSKISGAFKVAGVAITATVAAIGAVITALTVLGKKTLEFNKEQAKLNTAFQSMGMSAKQAGKTYQEMYRFLGDSGKATEAASHLAKITQNEQHLTEWTKIAQGVYATFGDSLPIEGLTESANETLRVGKVTGNLADALNWAGVSEDAFNAQLAQTNSLSEREALLRNTLNGLYKNAADIYEQNNKALLDYNESQAKLDATMASAGQATLPLMTALNNLGSAFFSALKPALDAIIPPLTAFVNWIAKAIESTLAFFSALTGKSQSVKVVANTAKQAASGLGSATSGAGALADGLGDTAKAAEEAKKSTQGFDELNIVSSNKSSSGSGGGSGGGGGSTPGYSNGGLFSNEELKTETSEGEGTVNSFAEKVKQIFGSIGEYFKTAFAPSIESWKTAFGEVVASWEESKPYLISGVGEIKTAFMTFGGYLLEDFIPSVVNSFSTNLAPVISDVLGFALVEGAKQFEWFGGVVNTVVNDVIIPAYQFMEGVITDVFDIIGNVWSEYGEPFMEALSGFFESIRGHLENFYNNIFKPIWDKVLVVVEKVWDNGLKPLVQTIVEAFMEIGTCLMTLYNKFIAPIVDWIMEFIAPIVVNVVNTIIDVVGSFVTHIANAISGVITTIKGIVEFITGVFTGDWDKAWQGIKDIFGGIWETIKGIAGSAWDAIRGIFEPVGAFFEGLWESITNIFSGVVDWFKGIFSKAWTAIKNVFSSVGSFFGGIWDTIKSKFTALGTKIGDAISGAVKKGINGVISLIEKTINTGIKLINGAITLINLIPGVNVSKIQQLSLPRLAKGGIVDSATIAMIGERGKEAVVPLENNTEWMDKLADRLAARSNTPSKIVLMLDGKELGWASIKSINGITRQTGQLQLKMV
jgi:phage-related protein